MPCASSNRKTGGEAFNFTTPRVIDGTRHRRTTTSIPNALGLKTLAEVERYTGQANQSLDGGPSVAKLRAIDRRRTGLPKPIRKVWERSQKMKQNQSEQIAIGAP
jgi:hypothetical protein